MIKIFNRYPLFSKRIVIAAVFISLVFSCSKNNSDPVKVANKYCTEIDWSNSTGVSGYFKGALANAIFGLTSESVTDNGISKNITFNRDASGHLINESGFTYTYNQDQLVKIVASDGTATGSGTFTFDTKGHLTNTVVKSSDDQGSTTATYTYTYDTNDDPVKIIGDATSTDNTGTSNAHYDITADYLTDKLIFFPLTPEITTFSIYFTYTFYSSMHLINKWVINITGTDSDGTALHPINFTQQYTYTYDTDGRLATMVHTGNSNNIYTFTYSGCN
jgi:YD repeat-containing protein